MAETLPVHLNRESLHAIEVGRSTHEVSDSFTLELHNHGKSMHVHVNVDDDLSRVASIESTNHYVETDAVVPVSVAVADGYRPVTGKIKVVTGYGAETAYVDLRVVEPDESEERVDVDESLGKPQRREETGGRSGRGVDVDVGESAPVLALAAVALGLVAVTLALVPGNAGLFVGVLAVLGGIGAALYLLLGE